MEKNEAATAATAASEAAPRPPPPSSSPSPTERAAIPLTWQQHHRGLKFSAELDTLWQRRCSHRHQGFTRVFSLSLSLRNFLKHPFSISYRLSEHRRRRRIRSLLGTISLPFTVLKDTGRSIRLLTLKQNSLAPLGSFY